MKRPWMLLLIAIISITTVALGLRKRSLGSLSLDGKEYLTARDLRIDFGKIEEGEEIEKTYVLKNTSKLQLQLRGAVSNCGCLTPSIDSRCLSPEDEYLLPVKFYSENRPGFQLREIFVLYRVVSDKEDKVLRLTLSGRVLARLLVTPTSIDFGEVTVGQKYRQKIRVQSEIIPNFTIERIYTIANDAEAGKVLFSNPRMFLFELSKIENGYEITCEFSPVSAILHKSVNCMVDYGNQRLGSQGINLRWDTPSSVNVFPPSFLGFAQGKIAKRFTVRARNDCKLDDFNIKSSIEEAKIREIKVIGDKHREFELSLENIHKRTYETGRLELVFKDPRNPSVEIPFAVKWTDEP